MKPVTPHKLKGFWYLIRRVPRRFTAFDQRGIVRISTHIRIADDPKAVRAATIAAQLNRDLEASWIALARAEKPQGKRRYDDALLDVCGVRFDRIAGALVNEPVLEVARRIEALLAGRLGNMPVEIPVGADDRPAICTSDLLTGYEEIMAATLSKMSPDQQRKWKNVRKRAVTNLALAGIDKPLTELTREDGVRFRKWWADRVINDGLEIKSANKELGIVNRMFTKVGEAKELNLQPVFSKLRIEGGVNRKREAFEVEFIQARILAPGMFDDLNPQARRVIYVMIETGLRPSEIVNLTAKRIKLNAPVPHVIIEPEGRVLKSEPSERKIPLVGVSLAAMHLQPEGFPRYYDAADSASNLINKALENRGLRPHEKHSLYSIRHAFEDRLTALKTMPDKIQAYLMGHSYPRPKYGGPPKLDHLAEWLNKIAFERFPDVL